MVNVETLCSNEVLAGDSGKSTYGPSEERVCDSCMPREGRRGPVSTSGKRTSRAAPKKWQRMFAMSDIPTHLSARPWGERAALSVPVLGHGRRSTALSFRWGGAFRLLPRWPFVIPKRESYLVKQDLVLKPRVAIKSWICLDCHWRTRHLCGREFFFFFNCTPSNSSLVTGSAP